MPGENKTTPEQQVAVWKAAWTTLKTVSQCENDRLQKSYDAEKKKNDELTNQLNTLKRKQSPQ